MISRRVLNCSSGARWFHSSTVSSSRRKTPKINPGPKYRVDVPLKLKAPIAPTTKNIKVEDDHPLWQFFHSKQFFRENPASTGRPWSIQELRRKSFEDLHTLWYVCLKERNILGREAQVASASQRSRDAYDATADEVRETMWRIRHVLSERQHAYENAKDLSITERPQYLKEFEQRYVESDASEYAQYDEKLFRIQEAFFGFPSLGKLDESSINELSHEGITYIAKLRAQRWAKKSGNSEFLPLKDIRESLLFLAYDEEKAVEEVKKVREGAVPLAKNDEISYIKTYVKFMKL